MLAPNFFAKETGILLNTGKRVTSMAASTAQLIYCSAGGPSLHPQNKQAAKTNTPHQNKTNSDFATAPL